MFSYSNSESQNIQSMNKNRNVHAIVLWKAFLPFWSHILIFFIYKVDNSTVKTKT